MNTRASSLASGSTTLDPPIDQRQGSSTPFETVAKLSELLRESSSSSSNKISGKLLLHYEDDNDELDTFVTISRGCHNSLQEEGEETDFLDLTYRRNTFIAGQNKKAAH